MSQKQELLGALIKHGYVHLRGAFSLTWSEWLWSLCGWPRRWRYNANLANLMHRLGETVHTPEFTDLDVSFLNHAVPVFLARRFNRWDLRLLNLLVQLHDSVPADVAGRITWHPSESLRRKLDKWARRNEQLAKQFQSQFD